MAAETKIEAKKAELVACSARIGERKEAQDADFLYRRRLFRELIGLGVRKSEIARIAGVTHSLVNDAIAKD